MADARRLKSSMFILACFAGDSLKLVKRTGVRSLTGKPGAEYIGAVIQLATEQKYS
jgi:hypothetical protein